MGVCSSSNNEVAPYESTNQRPTSNTKSSTNISQADIQKFRQDTLKYHNVYRKMHHAPPLANDAGLDKEAQAYAEKMAKSGNFAHAPANERNGAGENLFASYYTEVDGTILTALSKEATDCFYDEIKDYDFNNPGFSMSTGHFTQVVWCGSTKLGVGIAVGKSGFYMVARYGPAGNMMDAFEENVLPK